MPLPATALYARFTYFSGPLSQSLANDESLFFLMMSFCFSYIAAQDTSQSRAQIRATRPRLPILVRLAKRLCKDRLIVRKSAWSLQHDAHHGNAFNSV